MARCLDPAALCRSTFRPHHVLLVSTRAIVFLLPALPLWTAAVHCLGSYHPMQHLALVRLHEPMAGGCEKRRHASARIQSWADCCPPLVLAASEHHRQNLHCSDYRWCPLHVQSGRRSGQPHYDGLLRENGDRFQCPGYLASRSHTRAAALYFHSHSRLEGFDLPLGLRRGLHSRRSRVVAVAGAAQDAPIA